MLELDALGQAEQIREGTVSAVELVDAAIARIEALNPTLNCVVVECFDRAREDAKRVEAGPATPGPFAGVPVLLKDCGQEIEGVMQIDGSRAHVPLPPERR